MSETSLCGSSNKSGFDQHVLCMPSLMSTIVSQVLAHSVPGHWQGGHSSMFSWLMHTKAGTHSTGLPCFVIWALVVNCKLLGRLVTLGMTIMKAHC